MHILPHPGGGGERYVDVLSTLPGYRSERVFLAPGPAPRVAAPVLFPNVIRAHLEARDAEIVHVQGEIAAMFALPMLGRMPSVVTPNGLNFLDRSRGLRYRIAERNLRAVAGRASRIICVSDGERERIASLVPAGVADRLVKIHNGVAITTPPSPERLTAIRVELGIPPDAAVALFVGGLDEVKEPLVAVRAAAAACRGGAQLVLLVAGDGPLRAAVDAEANEHVRVLGFRRDVDVLNALADIFVLPSIREGLSNALLDAMASGAAPVVSRNRGNVEAVGESGIVVPVGDVAAFAEALAALVEDPETRERLGAQARARVERKFREDVMRERTRAVYEAVYAERRTGRSQRG